MSENLSAALFGVTAVLEADTKEEPQSARDGVCCSLGCTSVGVGVCDGNKESVGV